MNNAVEPSIRHAVVAALLVSLIAGIFAVGTGNPLKSTDDWRRTPTGWEHRSAWSPGADTIAAHRRLEPATARSARLDTHPAGLALLQLVGALLSLAVFGPQGRRLLKERPFSALLARSFRASVFGS